MIGRSGDHHGIKLASDLETLKDVPRLSEVEKGVCVFRVVFGKVLVDSVNNFGCRYHVALFVLYGKWVVIVIECVIALIQTVLNVIGTVVLVRVKVVVIVVVVVDFVMSSRLITVVLGHD